MVVDRQLSSSSLSLIPEDIIVLQIVGRISCIKTILRCTSVCKSWYSFITSTQFVKFHDDDNNINIDKRRLLCQYMEWGKGYCFSIHDDSENFHKHYSYTHNKLILEGSACHGLICYMNRHQDSLYLWNPVIRKVKKLPDIEYDSVISSTGHDILHKYYPVFKLWFDSNANDYKILIAYINTTYTFCVHVYSLKTNSWKLITGDVRFPTYNMHNLVHVNGTLYWFALTDDDKYWILVSLDTKSWMFRETPTRFQARCKLYLAPSNHDDSLVILRYPNIIDAQNSNGSVYNVYKYTTDEIYSVNIGEDGRIDLDLPLAVRPVNNAIQFRKFLGVRHNDELLLQIYNSPSVIFSYNMKTKKVTEFDLTRLDDHIIVQVTPFVETLALLDHTDAYKI